MSVQKKNGFQFPVYRISRLPNGLRVATAEMPHMTSVSLGIWAGAGSRYEPAPLNGVSHFIEHMLFKGTRRRSPLEISQAVEGIGGYLNAFTSEESTCFYSKARHECFEDLLDVLTDMYLHSRFAPEDIRKEREVIKEEVAQYYDEPQQYVLELLNALQWPAQPLGRPITGTFHTLDGMNRRHLTSFLHEHYRSGNTLICAAGRITHHQALKAVQAMAGKFATGKPPAFVPATARPQGPVVHLHWRKTEQTQFALGLRTCSRHDPARWALRLLSVVLGENMSSRLFQKLREDSGMAYSIQSSVSFFADTGDLVIAGGLDAEKLGPALEVIWKELEDLATRALRAAELRRARDYLLGQIDLSLENTESQMMNLGEQCLGLDGFMKPDEVKAALSRVTAAEMRAVAARFFRPDRCSLAVISSDKSLGRLALRELPGNPQLVQSLSA
jgi:predicted Zn-dependent peptidase